MKTNISLNSGYILNLSFVTLLAIYLVACTSKKENIQKIQIPTESIDGEIIKVNLKSEAERLFSSLFDSVRYVLLENRDEIPLVGNIKTVLSDKYIYIEDNELDNLFKYDHYGKLQTVFRSSGFGPTEFKQIEDYQVINDTVVIYDRASAKLIYLTNKGEFIKGSVTREGATNFHIGKDFKLFFLQRFLQ